ncbi:MAG TPA: phosphatase PAP2 family protein [Planctomycetota bacterium]|nr:phosphatase PAP2 family protein [Planctomycetota bacterium]
MLGLRHLTAWDRAASRQCNRINHHRLGETFALVSRLGDGWVWFALMALLPVFYGSNALVVSLAMVATGAIATLLYKLIKHSTHRLRPCESSPDLILTVAPLDRFSFPSGHTLHAVCFTIITCSAYPGWMWLLVPFTTLVGLSRLVLGLHYLSDVLVGAIIGGTLGTAAVFLVSMLGCSAWT